VERGAEEKWQEERKTMEIIFLPLCLFGSFHLRADDKLLCVANRNKRQKKKKEKNLFICVGNILICPEFRTSKREEC